MAKLSTKPFLNRGVVCNYSLARRAKIYKTFLKHLCMHKNVFFLTIEQKMYLKRLQKLRCLGWISKQDILRSAGTKTSFKSSKDDFVTKIFPHSTQRKRSIHLNFPSPFVSFNDLFLTLKCETLVLKTTAWCDSQMVWQF